MNPPTTGGACVLDTFKESRGPYYEAWSPGIPQSQLGDLCKCLWSVYCIDIGGLIRYGL